jgi:hypothetical protein
MDERDGTIRLADPSESEARGLVTTVPRAQVEEALRSDEPVDLLLDIERSTGGDGRETRRLALAWEREDLERMLENDGSEITLTFDEAELQQLLDEDVEAHGMRERLAVLTVVAAGIAAAGAGSALASPNSGDGSLAGGTAVPAATAQAPSSEISTGLGQQITAQGRLVVPSEISTGLGATTAATAATGRTGPSEISTGITGTASAPASEISTGIVGQTPAPSSEISTGIVQQPTATPVSADSPSWSPSPSEGAAIAVGVLLAITAAGFAVRSRRTGGPTVAT